MLATEIIQECKQKGIEITPAGDRLKCGPAERLSKDMLAEIRAHKKELLTILNVIEVFQGTIVESRTVH